MKEHISLVHAEKKSLQCKNCDQVFEKESYLDTHSSFIHKHLCNFCDKKFTAKLHLNKHIKSIHKNGSKTILNQKLDKALNGTPKVLNLTEIDNTQSMFYKKQLSYALYSFQ